MRRRQEKFIFEALEKYSICNDVKEKYTNKLNDISTPVIQNILDQKYVNGTDMKAVLCFFDTLLLSAKKGDKDRGIYSLSKNIKKWITKMHKLDVSSKEGIVYLSDVLSDNIQVIIKVPQEDEGFDDIIREYYIGLVALNRLRYFVPNFMYTLGAFICPFPDKHIPKTMCTSPSNDKTAFVIYEKIPGQGADTLLENNMINFPQFLEIFIQLLVALEVAQRECRFTHFDLHSGNVMIRPVESFEYSVSLDNNTYDITVNSMLLTIIDYGFASVYVDNRSIGQFGYEKYGMMNFMVPGYDMYKFLIYSASYARDLKTQKAIMQLFRFYGDDDTYKIVETGRKGLSKALNEYCAQGTYSNVAKYTPLQFLNWVKTHQEYKNKVKKYLKIFPRNTYAPLDYHSTVQEKYNSIFNHTQNENNVRCLNIITEKLKDCSSYIICSYYLHLAKKYGDYSHKIKNKENMIRIDNAMLEKYKTIKLPSQDILDKVIEIILSVRVRENIYNFEMLEVQLNDIGSFYHDLQPYLQLLYTIREINIETYFKKFISKFIKSPQYLFYNKNVLRLSQAIRWSKTIFVSLT